MIRPITRKPTGRELVVLQQQIAQLTVANPPFVTAVAILVNEVFGGCLKAGQVVPLDAPVFRSMKRKH